jgi:hypothetical protein
MRFFSLILSAYFFAGSMMPGGHWDELPRLFNLMAHYNEHQTRAHEESVSFMEFLAMHYDAGSGHQQQEDHSKLPFNHFCSSPLIAILALHLCEFNLPEITIEKFFPQLVFSPREHIADLLQPPR